MKWINKVACVGIAILSFSVFAYTETVNGVMWTYTVSNGEATIGNGASQTPAIPVSTSGAVIIPSTLGGCPVTSIGSYAFYGCDGLSDVTIPNCVTNICTAAFCGCGGLVSISLPFVGSRRGNSETADSLFGHVFGTQSYSGGVATKQYYSANSYKTYYIPQTLNNVKITDEPRLGYGAFSYCKNIVKVELSKNMRKIEGGGAFWGCEGLVSIIMPEGIMEIGTSAFRNCTRLAKISIPSSVMSIGSNSFQGCTGLEEVYISDLAAWCKIEFGNSTANPFAYADDLYIEGSLVENLAIPNGVESVSDYAFYGCYGLNSVSLPEGLRSIGEGAFAYCRNVKELAIPTSVLSIGSGALSGCSGLESISLPFIGSKRGNSGDSNSLFGFVFGSSDYSGGEKVCQKYSVDGYEEFCIPSSLAAVSLTDETIVGYGAFYGCSGLTSVIMSHSVTNIAVYAFTGCSKLANMTIPDSVRTIGGYAFNGCTGLESIELPFVGCQRGNSGTNDSNLGYIFGGSDNNKIPTALKSVIITDETILSNSSFSGCNNLTNVMLTAGIIDIGN